MDRLERALESLDAQLSADTLSGQQRIDRQNDYCPWSQEALLARAASFPWSWASRPEPADVLNCARHGWRCRTDGGDTMCCSFCRAELYLPWAEDLLAGTVAIIAQEYCTRIVDDGHAEGCPWRVRPCASDLRLARYKTPLAERDLLLKRCDTFQGVSVSTPQDTLVDPALLQKAGLGSTQLSGSLGLAMMQWELRDGHLLSCRFGCNTLLLTPSLFHPQEEHAWYCPFIQSGGLGQFLSVWDTGVTDKQKLDFYPLLSKFTSDRIREILAEP